MKTVRKQILYSLLAVLCGGLTWVAQAGTVTDNFDSGADFFVTGIIGQTNWDGVYFGAGDIVGGTGSGTTSQANETTFPGYLTVQGTVGAWVGNEDDSFFIYKVVAGDFDASVAIVPPFASLNYHLPGILARAYNTNNSGAPYSATVTNSVENWMYIARFQEFSINEHGRYATNGADHDGFFNTAGTDSDTNSTRFVRMTRVGDLFSFYEKTNAADAWVLCSTLNRSDLNGVAMQVGIKDESGTANQPITYFTNFVLSGPNVTQPAMPAAPSGLVPTATNISGSLTFSWTKGTPADGSLLVMKPTGNIDHNPVNGITYNSDGAFGDPTTLLAGANAFVVYNGTGNSVTISNLAGNNTTYSVAVYEYTNTGSSIVYNTASPATNYVAGPGQITGVIASMASTNIPIGGADAGFLFATFSSGGGTVDESTSGQTVWTSSDPTIAQFSGRVLYGVTNGTVEVVGTFAGTFSATNIVTVHSPTFADNFAQSQDYLANGLVGSTWDGLFLNFGDVPNANKGNDNVAGATSQLDANITTNNALRVQSAGSTWTVAGNDGPYLFKIVTGDFTAVVHVGTSSTINNYDAGIMARLFDNSGTATQGGGGGTGGTETHINWVKVQNGTPAVRRTIDSGGTTIVTGLAATDGWLCMQRVGSTNFYMYEAATPTTWALVASMTLPEAAGNAPMEVGIEQEMRTAASGGGSLDNAMIDGPGITPPAPPPPPANNFLITLNNDLSMTFNWEAADASGNPIRSMLIMRAGAPVTALPTLAQAGSIGGTGSPVNFGTGLNLSGGNWMVFATGNPAASTNVTATVQGLTPGVTYYAAIVTFTGSGGSKSFNTVVPPGATGSQQDGLLQSVKVLPIPGIPLGGLQVGQVIGYFGGQPVNVSAFAAVTVANTNVVQFADGAFTGIALGSTTAQIVYGGVTNTIGLTVRAAGFTDEFGVNQDYLLNGVTNSPYDGVYRQGIDANEVPESQYSGVDLNGSGLGTAAADANVTSNNVLTISATGDGWENDLSGGFFLFKYVPGDFQTAIHINSLDANNYNQPGLMARAFSYGTNGTDIGSPFVLGFGVGRTNINNIAITNGESWVSFTRFDEFGLGTYPRLNLDSAVQQFAQTDQGDTNMWLLITRSGGTEFTFYKRLSTAGPWRLTPNKVSFHIPEFAGVPMQVGIAAGPFWWTTGANRTVMFEHYMLDVAPPALQASHSGGSVKLTWPAISAGAFLQQTLSLNPANWQTVPGTLTTNAGTISINVPMTNSAAFFRLSTP